MMTSMQAAILIGLAFFLLIGVIACAIRLTLICREVQGLVTELRAARTGVESKP